MFTTGPKERGWFRNWLSRRRETKAPSVRLQLEALESRDLMSGVWTALTNLAPATAPGTTLLMSDGTVMEQDSAAMSQWAKLTPDASGNYANGTWSSLASMNNPRLYFPSIVLPSGKVFVVGGEYTNKGDVDFNGAETFDPVANTWTASATFPQNQFGDAPAEILPNGNILAGYLNGPATYIYNPATNTWSFAANKLGNDSSAEETWVKLPDGSILSYDVNSGDGRAQRYVPSTNTWVDAGVVPVALSGSAVSGEIGPALLLPDGRVFQIGATNQTALYTPSTNTWAVGPSLPAGMGADDTPAAILPNGHVIFAADQSTPKSYQPPAELFDFDPVANTITQMTTPPALTAVLNGAPAYEIRMLVLPTGQLLFTPPSGKQLYVYTPDGTAEPSWQPTIAGVANQGNGNFTLTGTLLTGISEGASYGDDAEMSSNYPIVQLTDASGNVFYARTSNWSYTGVSAAGDATAQTANFTLPNGLAAGNYNLSVIANGIASAPTPFVVPAAPTAVQVDLSAAFNDAGMVKDGSSFAANGGLDGGGHALSSTLLGASVVFNSNTFNLGAAGVNNVAAAAGQTIALPAGSFSTLNFLATAVSGNQANQSFVVTYTDGTTQTFTQSISDWFTPQNYVGESKAVSTAYRDNAAGTADNRPFYVYGYSFTLAAGKTAKSLTLPINSRVNVLAVTLTPAAPPAPPTPPVQPQVDLSSAFNDAGIATDGSTFAKNGGLDGGGQSLSFSQLGSSVAFNGNTFYLGAANSNDVVSAAGQTIALPAGNFGVLNFLATAVSGNQANQTFTVTYTDGTTQTFTQSVSDWFTPQNYVGESKAVTTTYRDNANGTADNRPFYVYGYSFTLAAGKTAKSLTLPNNSHVNVLAVTMAPPAAPVTAPATQTPADLSGAYNSAGIVKDGSSFAPNGGLDGGGHALSSALLGSSVAFNGNTFNLGAAGANNVVAAAGQTIALPAGAFTTLNFLATAISGNQANQSFTVTYTDGTTQTFPQSISDWFTPQNYVGESKAVSMAYRDNAAGTADNRPFYVYGYSFALAAGKTAQSITLPNNTNVKILAVTMAP